VTHRAALFGMVTADDEAMGNLLRGV